MEIAGWISVSLIALAVGSFINVVVCRLPQQLADPHNNVTLWRPGSRCPHCFSALRASDLIPLLSWLRLRGRCRACRHRISVRYPLTELATLLITLALTWLLPAERLAAALLLSWALLALSLIDIEHLLLPDAITLPLLWLGLLINVLHGLPVTLDEAVLGAAAGYGTLRLLATVYAFLRGYPGLGGGDAKLLAALGAWLGASALPAVLFLACSAALLAVFIARLRWSRAQNQPLAFGPWLSLAGISVFIHSII